jgi:membrane protein DedA with SNARE-associated domain
VLHAWIDALTRFVQAHAAWAAPIVFAFSFLKSLAFVELVVPGITIMLAIGALIGSSGIAFLPVWLAATVGAALGDWVSYSVGRRLHGRARDMWPFSRYPEWLVRGDEFFHRWGAMSVLLCRFFGPLRAVIPLLCGIFEMRRSVFQVANWLSAAIWGATLLLPGSLLGAWFR